MIADRPRTMVTSHTSLKGLGFRVGFRGLGLRVQYTIAVYNIKCFGVLVPVARL